MVRQNGVERKRAGKTDRFVNIGTEKYTGRWTNQQKEWTDEQTDGQTGG
jgi:hypothetical protein